MQPVSVGVREAKMNLSRLLRMVQKGVEIILTDRGKPVGKIVPIKSEALPLPARIRNLEERGIIESRTGKGRRIIPPPIPVPDNAAQRILQEEREDDGK